MRKPCWVERLNLEDIVLVCINIGFLGVHVRHKPVRTARRSRTCELVQVTCARVRKLFTNSLSQLQA